MHQIALRVKGKFEIKNKKKILQIIKYLKIIYFFLN